jgi:putative nucleotidyltransferase with HDIG domain
MQRYRNGTGLKAILEKIRFPQFRLGSALASVFAFLLSSAAIIWGSVSADVVDVGGYKEFEVGRVADRDIFADQSVSYVDEDATRLRIEAEERLVPAVFVFSREISEESRASYDRFAALSRGLFTQGSSAETYKLAVQAQLPGAFSADTLDALFRDPGRDRMLEYGSNVLEHLLEAGIVALPQVGLELFNPDEVDLYHDSSIPSEPERIPYERLITSDSLRDPVRSYIAGNSFPAAFSAIAVPLLSPFITENVFFSPQETNRRLTETRAKVTPVTKYIEQGERIIRRGFIVSDTDMTKLRALTSSLPGYDPRPVIGHILVLLLVYGFIVFLEGKRTVGRILTSPEVYLISILTVLYIVGAVFLRVLYPDSYFPAALILPTALVVMLPTVLIGFRLALVMALTLPLGAFLSGSFDVSSFIFAITSGVIAVYVLRHAEKRIDLIRAGFILAAAHIFTALALLLIQREPVSSYPVMLLLAGFNGIASGMLVLGFLPVLEHLLNAATTFRLIELSDLNSPILKRLFIAAPGTYSHSVMVANLAESACQEIGANPLLARVGAYYHDIGKIEQPDYFVENQTAYNKHDAIPPRLSATVIRSHVKLGVEKARQLGLPKEVLDIIAEHHGNSVISWFYHEALKREAQVNMEDFTYPGSPPHSRESAVVMLSDVTEAAVRTLKKPTAARLEKFIHELIMSKFDSGQLWESDLTFRELQTIEHTFVRVLAGHYHSRIEYSKQIKESLQIAAVHAANRSDSAPGSAETGVAPESRGDSP